MATKRATTSAAVFIGEGKPLVMLVEGQAYDTRRKEIAEVVKLHPELLISDTGS